jgi:hypothetical protein
MPFCGTIQPNTSTLTPKFLLPGHQGPPLEAGWAGLDPPRSFTVDGQPEVLEVGEGVGIDLIWSQTVRSICPIAPLKAADKPASKETSSVLVHGDDRSSGIVSLPIMITWDVLLVFEAVTEPPNDAKKVVVMAMVIAENFMVVLGQRSYFLCLHHQTCVQT